MFTQSMLHLKLKITIKTFNLSCYSIYINEL